MNEISTGWRGADEIRRGVTYIARLAPMRSGEAVAMTAATVRVLDASGAVVVSGAATVAANVGTYEILNTVTADLDPSAGWLIEWTPTLTDHPGHGALRNPADLVLYGIEPAIAWSDLLTRHPDLAERLAVGSDVETAEDRGQAALDEAFASIRTRLRAKGERPTLIVDPYMFAEPHAFAALAILFRGLSTAVDSIELAMAKDYEDKLEAYWLNTTFEPADESTWKRTMIRKSPAGATWAGSTPAARFRPNAGVSRCGGW